MCHEEVGEAVQDWCWLRQGAQQMGFRSSFSLFLPDDESRIQFSKRDFMSL
jgi:hypothetical protein